MDEINIVWRCFEFRLNNYDGIIWHVRHTFNLQRNTGDDVGNEIVPVCRHAREVKHKYKYMQFIKCFRCKIILCYNMFALSCRRYVWGVRVVSTWVLQKKKLAHQAMRGFNLINVTILNWHGHRYDIRMDRLSAVLFILLHFYIITPETSSRREWREMTSTPTLMWSSQRFHSVLAIKYWTLLYPS